MVSGGRWVGKILHTETAQCQVLCAFTMFRHFDLFRHDFSSRFFSSSLSSSVLCKIESDAPVAKIGLLRMKGNMLSNPMREEREKPVQKGDAEIKENLLFGRRLWANGKMERRKEKNNRAEANVWHSNKSFFKEIFSIMMVLGFLVWAARHSQWAAWDGAGGRVSYRCQPNNTRATEMT